MERPRPELFAADSAYRSLEPVPGAELRPAFDEHVPGSVSEGGFRRDQVWFGSTDWHESNGSDFVAHYEIRGLDGLSGWPLVLFSGFALDFKGSVDHRIDFLSAVIEPLGFHAGRLHLRVTGGLRDRGYSEPYNWKVYFQVVGGPAAGA
jgi:hypothetical protein